MFPFKLLNFHGNYTIETPNCQKRNKAGLKRLEAYTKPRNTSLKYFCEDDRHSYYILAAGSLLGIAMRGGTSFPVGKVDSMDLYPLSFTEFLDATRNEPLLALLRQRDFEMVSVFRDKYIDLLKTYYFVGGMPAAVSTYLPKRNLSAIRRVQRRADLGL